MGFVKVSVEYQNGETTDQKIEFKEPQEGKADKLPTAIARSLRYSMRATGRAETDLKRIVIELSEASAEKQVSVAKAEPTETKVVTETKKAKAA